MKDKCWWQFKLFPLQMAFICVFFFIFLHSRNLSALSHYWITEACSVYSDPCFGPDLNPQRPLLLPLGEQMYRSYPKGKRSQTCSYCWSLIFLCGAAAPENFSPEKKKMFLKIQNNFLVQSSEGSPKSLLHTGFSETWVLWYNMPN